MPFEIVRNDITRMQVDAIVNAANETLLGGGGVDGAIHRAAGPQLLEECRGLGGCRAGEARITGAYRLPCRYVIHTVGPIWQGGENGEAAVLAACYQNSLKIAADHACESIAFPLISAGAYGYPRSETLKIATDTIRSFLQTHDMMVYLVVFDTMSFAISSQLYAQIQAYIDDAYVEPRLESVQGQRYEWWKRNTGEFSPIQQKTEDIPQPPPACSSAALKEAAGDANSADVSPKKKKKESIFHKIRVKPPTPAAEIYAEPEPDYSVAPSLSEYLQHIDEGFRDMLLRKIDESGMTDAECYKKANIDRKLFSKIKNQPGYKPGKPTVLAFAIALELPLEETREMLMKAGFSLTHSSKFDLIVEYFIRNGNYDIFEINEALFSFDQSLLGSAVL